MRQKARHKARIDANQPKIVKTIRSLGGSWQGTHQIPGALDGIVGYRGVDFRAEIKVPGKRKLTPAEQDVFDNWRGRKPVILETDADVIAAFKQINLELVKKR